jgi:8-oxo-dGTP diphosphatase
LLQQAKKLSVKFIRGVNMLKEVQTVTSFLESDGEILILLRSKKVRTYKHTWGGVSGLIDPGHTADEQAVQEIAEETGLAPTDIQLIKKGEPLIIDEETRNLRKVVYPYLYHISNRNKVKIDWEHTEYKWIKPEEMHKYPTMPQLKETLDRVLL